MAEDVRAIVKRKVEEKGLGQYWPVLDSLVQLESGWETIAHNTQGESSVGLFQNNQMQGGLGTGYTTEQLKNPEINAEIALSKIASVIQAGGTIYDALGDWVNARNMIFSGAAPTGGGTMVSPTQEMGATGQPPGYTYEDALDQARERLITMGKNLLRQQYESQGQPVPPTISDDEALNLAIQLTGTMPEDLANEWFQGWQQAGVAATPITAYQQQGLAQTQEQIDQGWVNTNLAEVAQLMEQKGWPVEMAAEEFANRLTRATEVTSRAETMEDIYQQQWERRAPAPGAPTVSVVPKGPWEGAGFLPGQIPTQPTTWPGPEGLMQRAEGAIPQVPPLYDMAQEAMAGLQAPQGPQAAPMGGGGGEQYAVGPGSSIMEAASRILGGTPQTPTAPQGMGIQKAMYPGMFAPTGLPPFGFSKQMGLAIPPEEQMQWIWGPMGQDWARLGL